MAHHIKADGTEQDVSPANGVEFTLAEMNKFVGGYLEAIALTPENIMYFNEEGIRLQLPLNLKATALVQKNRPEMLVSAILGDVIIASKAETGDEEEDEEDEEETEDLALDRCAEGHTYRQRTLEDASVIHECVYCGAVDEPEY